MPGKTPLPGQATIDYSRRGRELNDLRDLRLGDREARLLLLLLDNLIGSNWSYVDRTIEEMCDLCEMSRSTLYDRLARLQRDGLVSVEDLPTSPRKRWRIVRSNVHELAEQARRTKTLAQTQRRTKARRVTVRHTEPVRETDEPVRETDEPVRETDEPVRETDEPVRETDCTILPRSQHAPTRPPSVQGPHDESGRSGGWSGLIARLAGLGLTHASQLVERAADRGSTPEALHALVDHWERLREEHGWGVAALGKRIKWDAPGLPVGSGPWPETRSSPPRKATPVREAPQADCPHCGARPPHFPRTDSRLQCSDCSSVFSVADEPKEVTT